MAVIITPLLHTLKTVVIDGTPVNRSITTDARDITAGVAGPSYRVDVGGIPLEGSVQDYLNANSADIHATGVSLGVITPYVEDWPAPTTPTVTTNNTPTEIASIPLPNLFFGFIQLTVCAVASNGTRKMWHFNGSVSRLLNGPAIDGTTTQEGGSPWGSSPVPGWTLSAAIPSGQNRIAISGTGANGLTINWVPDLRIRRFSP